MTALSVPARPEEDASLRPVPWQRMGWVTWRQHRATLAWVIVFLGVLAVLVYLAGRQLYSAHAAALAACQSASSPTCPGAIIAFNGTNGFLANGFMLQAIPPLIGAFVGAPLLARELETGTFRYAWTQGFGRWRWTLAKLVPLAVVLATAAGVFSLLLNWYYQPYFAAGNQNLTLEETTPFFPGIFDLRGIGFAAWTLAAFSIGALAGLLIRRVVPAIVATLVAYAALAFAAGGFLRQHYLAPLVTSNLDAARLSVDHQPVVDQGRQVRLRRLVPPTGSFSSSARTALRGRWGLSASRRASRSASPRTATRSGPPISPPAGSGRSSGSRAAGCSCCRPC